MTRYLCDTNVWLALALAHHVHHPPARAWFDTVDDPGSILFIRTTQQSFLRLLTTRAVLAPYGAPPLTNIEAWAAFESFLADYRIELQTAEPPCIDEAYAAFALRPSASPKLWMDAYLAAFALSEECTLVTTDTAFRQFPGLELRLIASPG